jgi:uncharacterized protein (DUF302 family)
MFARLFSFLGAAALIAAIALTHPVEAPASSRDGVVRVKSSYSMTETVKRLKNDIADKQLMFFVAIDQSKLAAEAGIKLRPSTLLMFGNPGLGSHFITADPDAGLDWPVRLLVFEDEDGQVWTAYSDFEWIARRHRITNRKAEFAMATKVIASITSSVVKKEGS